MGGKSTVTIGCMMNERKSPAGWSLVVAEAEAPFFHYLLFFTILGSGLLLLWDLAGHVLNLGPAEIFAVRPILIYSLACFAAWSSPRVGWMPLLLALFTAIFASVLYEVAWLFPYVFQKRFVYRGMAFYLVLTAFVNIVSGILAGVVMQLTLPKPSTDET